MRFMALTFLTAFCVASPLVVSSPANAAPSKASAPIPHAQTPPSPQNSANFSDSDIDAAIELALSRDAFGPYLKIQYDEGVATAFREAYAMSAMTALWSERSAAALISDIRALDAAGIDVSFLNPQAEKAYIGRFNAESAQRRATADLILSAAYIAYLDISAEHSADGKSTQRFVQLAERLYSKAVDPAGGFNHLALYASP